MIPKCDIPEIYIWHIGNLNMAYIRPKDDIHET